MLKGIQDTDPFQGKSLYPGAPPDSKLLSRSSWVLQLLEVSASFDHFVDGIEGLLKTQPLQTTAGLDLPQSVSVCGQTQLIRNLIKTRTFSRFLPTWKLMLALSLTPLSLPLVWSWSLAGLSYWPEPSEEHWSTFPQLGSSSGPSGPQAFLHNHCCPPQKPGPYSPPSSTWIRALSQRAGPEHQGERQCCLYLQLGLMLFCPPISHTVRDVFLSRSRFPTLKPMVGDVSITLKLKLSSDWNHLFHIRNTLV